MKTKFPKKWFVSLNDDYDYIRYITDNCYLYRIKSDDISNQNEFFDILLNLKVTLDSAYIAKLKYVSMMYSLDNSNYFTKIKSNSDLKIDSTDSAILFKFIDKNGNTIYIITDYIRKFKFNFDYELFRNQFSGGVSFFKVDETTFKNTIALDNIIDECKNIVNDRKQAEIKQYRIDNNLCIKCGSEFMLIHENVMYANSFGGKFNYYMCKNEECRHDKRVMC